MSTLIRTIFVLIAVILSNGLQTFHTNSMDNYRDDIISCDESEDCVILCDHIDSCRNTQINCPIDHVCDITCSATKACANTIIIATHVSSLTIHDCATGSFTCKGISIYLPPNNNGTSRAIIDGADDGLSEGAGHNDTFDVEDEIPMNFYAIYGWDDIDIINYSGSFKYHGGFMHCTVGYGASCPFSDNSWACSSVGHICNNPTIEYTNTDEMENIHELWYIIHALAISTMSVVCILIICSVRSYRTEKEFKRKYAAANDEISKLRKMYNDYSPISCDTVHMNAAEDSPQTTDTVITALSECVQNKSNKSCVKPQNVSDENVAAQILSVNVDLDAVDVAFSPSSENNYLAHSPITPSGVWNLQITNLKDTLNCVIKGDTPLQMTDIPTSKSTVFDMNKTGASYSDSTTVTRTKTAMSNAKSMIIPPHGQLSAHSSMFVIFNEMNTAEIDAHNESDTESSQNIISDSSISTILTANEEFEYKQQMVVLPENLCFELKSSRRKLSENNNYYSNYNMKQLIGYEPPYEHKHIFTRDKNLSVLNDANESDCQD